MTGKFSKNTTKESNDMKRIGNVYSKIYDIENLKLAHKKARKDKFGTGTLVIMFYWEKVLQTI